MQHGDDVRRAVRAREEADRRIRVTSAAALALAVCLAAVFAALAAATTHTAKRIVRPSSRVRRLPPLTRAPAPPLVSAHDEAPAPPAAVAPPAVSAAPPVASSGGS
jgi:hypothetical protein